MQIMEICIPYGNVKTKSIPPWINKRAIDIEAILTKETSFFIPSNTQANNQNLNNADAKTLWKIVRLLNGTYNFLFYATLFVPDSPRCTTAESTSNIAHCLNNYFYTCFNHNYPPLTDELSQDLNLGYGYLCSTQCLAELLCFEESVLKLLAELNIYI